LKKGKKAMKRMMSVMMLLAIAVGATVSVSAVEPAGKLSKSELKTLIQTAKTPADHLKLASYYRYEASTLAADIKEHQEMAAAYDQNPSLKALPKGQTLGDHCRSLVRYLGEDLKEANEMVTIHEEMAKAAR